MKAYVLHENPTWYEPFAAAFEAEGIDHEQWLLGEGQLDLDAPPPPGVFWSRASAPRTPAGTGTPRTTAGPSWPGWNHGTGGW